MVPRRVPARPGDQPPVYVPALGRGRPPAKTNAGRMPAEAFPRGGVGGACHRRVLSSEGPVTAGCCHRRALLSSQGSAVIAGPFGRGGEQLAACSRDDARVARLEQT
eukprot:gene17604-biopygen1298